MNYALFGGRLSKRKIVGIDLHDRTRTNHSHPNFTYLKQNAQDLSQFANEEFDLAVSVGMLEHITDDVVFGRIASEIQRVAKQYIVVVPYRYCWIEPHYGVPFFPLFPYPLKLVMVKLFNLSNDRPSTPHPMSITFMFGFP